MRKINKSTTANLLPSVRCHRNTNERETKDEDENEDEETPRCTTASRGRKQMTEEHRDRRLTRARIRESGRSVIQDLLSSILASHRLALFTSAAHCVCVRVRACVCVNVFASIRRAWRSFTLLAPANRIDLHSTYFTAYARTRRCGESGDRENQKERERERERKEG